MNKFAVVGLGLLLSVGMTGMVFAAEATGTLEDGFCYNTMGAHGASHRTCAIECAKKGIPVVLLEKDGKQVVLLPAQDKASLPSSVLDNMEDKVTVTGDELNKGGNTYLTVKSVKKL
ncbi:MAG: hypothetical protein ACREQ4_08125 [Candidatus Binataceae bacterium]